MSVDEITSTSDAALVRQFVADRSPVAFEQLVERYAGMVFAAALRQVRDPAMAEDVTQAVFIVLARKAGTLTGMPTIGGWLMKVTRYAAINARRKESVRRRYEDAAARDRAEAIAVTAHHEHNDEWAMVAPQLDAALSRLGSIDRDAIVLRYFEGQSFSSIAQTLGLGEAAARKRVDRALDKLRGILARRGVTAPTAAIATAVTLHASASVSSAFVATIVGGAMVSEASVASGAVVSLSIAKGAIHMMAWAKATAVAGVISAVVVIGGGAIGVRYALAQSNAAPRPATAPAAAANDDRQAIQGTWYQLNPLGAATQAARVEPARPMRIVITATELQLPDQNAGQPTKYTIDPQSKHIDLVARGQTAPGIYELNGETLKIALPFRDGRDRPTEMKDSPQVRVMVLSRNPPPQPPAAAQPDARILGARADLTSLETALDAFEIDTGRYPTTAEGLNALRNSPFAGRAGADNWRGPYVRMVPNDPWGRPYRYRYPGAIRPQVLQLWSTGPDGQDGTADDITNWEQ